MRVRPGWITTMAILGIVAAACVPSAPNPDPAPPYAPPVSPGPYAELDLVRDDGSRASMPDPEVIRVGDRWYLYGTTANSRGFEGWSSTDLASWDYEGFVWRPTPGSWNEYLGGAGYWAPNVVADDDGFLLYYTARERIGVARADSPAGPFVDLLDRPLVGDGFGGVGDGVALPVEVDPIGLFDLDDRALDAFHLRTSSGERYLYFSYRPTVEAQQIGVVRLLDDAVLEPRSLRSVLGTELVSWEGTVREGPWVEERDGRFWLTYSGSPYLFTCYGVGEAVADTPTGPFRRVADGPFLHDDPSIGFYGPGHHSFTTGPDGEDLIFFHTRQTPEGEVPRQTRWAPVTRDDQGRVEMVDPPGRVGAGRTSCWPFPL